MTSKKTYVYISLNGKDILLGNLWFRFHKGKESASFEYDNEWLVSPERFAIDPALKLTAGAFHTRENQNIFGSIGDSAPDTWGRILMRRNEGQKAKNEKRDIHTLNELDYLLGVNDMSRQGALRFSNEKGGDFLTQKEEGAIPPLVDLPKLLSASNHFLEKKESESDLKLLFAPGSSLGGARPKASILDTDGNLSIAKFPKTNDEYNVVLWEAVALILAKKAWLDVPFWKIETVLDKQVLIIRRFDRIKETRIPFLSAMSMLEAKDNEQHSYLEIVDALAQTGTSPEEDMKKLWRRIVFSIMISNTDDHLRNHGFLYQKNGWRLSPVYDVNPTPLHLKEKRLTTFIDLYENKASLKIALSVIKEFRISKETAHQIIKEVETAVSEWKTVAKKLGLKNKEIEFMSSAFENNNDLN